MAAITASQVAEIAWLARMELPASAVPRYAEELSRILALADALSQAPVNGIAPLGHPLEDLDTAAPGSLRDDRVTEAGAPESAAADAGARRDANGGCYLVPAVIEPSP